jgi:ectoine hydroxylase-related dioxygenase (phytanoyl-CoA dioxygenase family)
LEFVRLTPEQRRSFADDGFLVVPNALSKEKMDALVEASDRLAQPLLRKPELKGRPEFNHLDLRPGLLKEEALLKLVDNGSTVPLVVQLMSPNIHLHSTTLIYKRSEEPDAPTFRRGWHRDIRIPRDLGHENLPMVGMKICYCLTDFHEPNSGMTLMARGSHRKQTALGLRKDAVDPVDVEVCDLRLNAGDAFIFENRIFHTATPNRSNRTSKVLMYGYSYRWMKPEIYLEVPDKALLSKAGPVARQLLGEYRDVDTVPWALQDWARKNGVLPETVPWTVEVDEVN